MRVVSYDILQRAIARKTQLDPDNLDQVEFESIRDAVSQALEEIWRYDWWPDLKITEQRRYRDAYDSATAYVAGDEVYHIASDAYYVALRASTGNDPATEVDGEWETETDYWAASERSYDADDYDAATAYASGDQVFYPVTGRHYQCFASSTGNAPTNTTYWGELVPFEPYIPYVQTDLMPIGDVIQVTQHDPRVYLGATPFTWERTTEGILVMDQPTPNQVWVQYRRRVHRLTGDAYDATASYEPDAEESSVPTTGTIFDDKSLGMLYEAPEVKTYTMWQYVTKAGTIASFIGKTASGTLTCTIKVDGVTVTGLSGIAITSTESTTPATANNAIEIGQTITMQVTAVSSPADFAWVLRIT